MKSKSTQKTAKDLQSIGIPKVDLTLGGGLKLHTEQNRNLSDLLEQLLTMPEDRIPETFHIQLTDGDYYFWLGKHASTVKINDEQGIINAHEASPEAEWFLHEKCLPFDSGIHPNSLPIFTASSFRVAYLNFLAWYLRLRVFNYVVGEIGVPPSDAWNSFHYEMKSKLLNLWDRFNK